MSDEPEHGESPAFLLQSPEAIQAAQTMAAETVEMGRIERARLAQDQAWRPENIAHHRRSVALTAAATMWQGRTANASAVIEAAEAFLLWLQDGQQ